MEYEIGKVYPFFDNGIYRVRFLGKESDGVEAPTDGRVDRDGNVWQYLAEEEEGAMRPTTFGESLQRGVMRTGEGLKQAAMMVGRDPGLEDYTQEVNRRRTDFEARGGSRFFGSGMANMATQLPLALIPGGLQGTLGRRLALNFAGGMAGGATEFSPTGTVLERAGQTAIGGMGGAALPEAARAGMKHVAAPVMRRVTNAPGRGPAPGSGPRAAAYDAVGVQPTSAQVTRDPMAWGAERNWAQQAGIGDPLVARFDAQGPRLNEVLDEVVPGPAMSDVAAGRQIQDAIGRRSPAGNTGIHRSMGDVADDLFDQAARAPGGEELLDGKKFSQAVQEITEDFEDVIPAAVLNRLNQFTDGARPMSIREANKFRQLINARVRGADAQTQTALNRLKHQLDGFVDESGVGGEALALYRQGTAASARRAQALGTQTMQSTVSRQLDPDKFVRRGIIGDSVDNLRRLRVTLLRQGGEQGKEAWEAARRQVVQYIQDRVTGPEGTFNARRYKAALKRLGDDKLAVIFTPDELQTMRTLATAAEGLLIAPANAAVNYSGTAAAKTLADPMQGAGFVSGLLRPLLLQFRGDAAVQKALRASDLLDQGPFNLALANRFVNPSIPSQLPLIGPRFGGYQTNPLAVLGGTEAVNLVRGRDQR